MSELVLIGVAFVVVVVLISLSVWGVMTKKYEDGNALDEIQNLSDRAAALIDTARIYKNHGMDEEALECVEEADRLNKQVWEVINGA